MLIPIGDENPRYSTPYVNYGLIGLNAVIFLFVATSGRQEQVWTTYGMKPAVVWREPLTLITSMFLHAGLLHLIGNLLFLWIVGDNVEDALGHVWYLAAYLGGGVAADLVHAGFDPASMVPTIGASGAISAVMGFYVVIFPHNRIRIFYWVFWFLVGTFYARAIWVIGAWFVLQLLWAGVTTGQAGAGGVAYWAHVGGFVFGAGLAVALRALVPTINPHLRRGGQSIDGTVWPAGGGLPRGLDPFGSPRAADDVPITLRPAARPAWAAADVDIDVFGSPQEAATEILRRLAAGDAVGAGRAFAAYARRFPHRPLDPAVQLRLVQALEQSHRHADAAACLEHFLTTHPADVNAPEAKLALGMIYGRHLGRPDLARPLLRAAAAEHRATVRALLAQQELEALHG